MREARSAPKLLCLGLVTAMVLVSSSSSTGDGRSNTSPFSASTSPAAVTIAVHGRPTIAATAPSAATLEGYGKLPLAFEANQGQSDPRVKFISRGSGYSLFLTSNEAVLSLRAGGTTVNEKKSAETGLRFPPPGRPAEVNQRFDEVRRNSQKETSVRIGLVGANSAASPAGLDELPGKLNYFIGSDRRKWRTNVPVFARVRYKSVYPGVDLIYHGDERQLEYDFAVAPGANPDVIRMSFGGLVGKQRAVVPQLGADGSLSLRTSAGNVEMRSPFVYQQAGDGRQQVPCRYALLGKDQVGFTVGAYDRNKPLIIDPVVMYSTYLGGANIDSAEGIAVDASGSAYIVGITWSDDFPTTPGTLQATFKGTADVFITKLSADGKSLIYSTYLGGSSGCGAPIACGDTGNAIAVGSDGSAFISGVTFSNDFPTTSGAFQTSNKNTEGTAFVAKLAPDGKSLVYSTYLGGSGCSDPSVGEQELLVCEDTGNAIAVDSVGSAYVAGTTGSLDFPMTPGAFQTGFGGYNDAFVTKLAPDGNSLVYSTYLGGSVFDYGRAIAVDSGLNAYITGTSSSADFPTTPGVFQPAILDDQSAFVSKLAPDGKSLIYSSYLGGTGSEYDHPCGICEAIADVGTAIVVDSAFNTYVVGSTNSATFPTTENAFQSTSSGAFLTKINADGTSLLYSTYFGSAANGVALDPITNGNVYLTGETTADDFPIVNAVQQACGGCPDDFQGDAFVARIDTTQSGANSLVFSSFLGGTPNDSGTGIAVDGLGNAYVAGHTGGYTPNSFPITPGAFQVSPGGDQDGFVVKISPNSAPGFTVSQGKVDFGNEIVTTATSLTFAVGNAGTEALNISSIALTGTNSAEFSESNTCGSSVTAGGSCNVTATFTPVAGGIKTAAITFSDDAANSPHSVPLTGVGFAAPDFTISASPSTATVTAGQPKSYAVTLTPVGGFTGTVSLGCSGAPTSATCATSVPVSVNGPNPPTATVTVTTTARSIATPQRIVRRFWPRGGLRVSWLFVLLFLAMVMLMNKSARRPNQRLAYLSFAGVLLFAFLCVSGCNNSIGGSSGGGGTPVGSPGTPAGTYTLTITGTSGNIAHNTTVALVVN